MREEELLNVDVADEQEATLAAGRRTSSECAEYPMRTPSMPVRGPADTVVLSIFAALVPFFCGCTYFFNAVRCQ